MGTQHVFFKKSSLEERGIRTLPKSLYDLSGFYKKHELKDYDFESVIFSDPDAKEKIAALRKDSGYIEKEYDIR